MKKTLQHSISIIMAMVVLFSTLSFTVDKHYCGSVLIDTAVWSKAKTCGMEIPASGKESLASSSCCSNKTVAVQGQDELKHSFYSFTPAQQVFTVIFTYSYFYLFESLPQEVVAFQDYIPPLLTRDISTLHETFLI